MTRSRDRDLTLGVWAERLMSNVLWPVAFLHFIGSTEHNSSRSIVRINNKNEHYGLTPTVEVMALGKLDTGVTLSVTGHVTSIH